MPIQRQLKVSSLEQKTARLSKVQSTPNLAANDGDATVRCDAGQIESVYVEPTVEAINDCYEQLERNVKPIVVAIGKALIEFKANNLGNFQKLFAGGEKAVFSFAYRTASQYMQIANNAEKLKADGYPSVRAMLADVNNKDNKADSTPYIRMSRTSTLRVTTQLNKVMNLHNLSEKEVMEKFEDFISTLKSEH